MEDKQEVKKEDLGLYEKFRVTRTDGSSEPGGKHHGCRYLVLDLEHDPHAKEFLLAYAQDCEAGFPRLAADLRWLAEAPFIRQE